MIVNLNKKTTHYGIIGRTIAGFLLLFACILIAKAENLPKTAAKKEVKAIVETNYHDWIPQDELFDVERPIKIVDLGYIQYSRAFAEKYGYPEELISDELDEHMAAIEFKMMTYRIDKKCYLNVLIDDKANVMVPEHDFIRREGRWERFRLPVPKNKVVVNGVTQPLTFYKDGINVKAALSTKDYKPRVRGSHQTLTIDEFSRDYYSGYYFYSFVGVCTNYTSIEEIWNNAELWIRKAGLPDTFSNKRTEHVTFKIPKKIKQKALEWTVDNDAITFDAVEESVNSIITKRKEKEKTNE